MNLSTKCTITMYRKTRRAPGELDIARVLAFDEAQLGRHINCYLTQSFAHTHRIHNNSVVTMHQCTKVSFNTFRVQALYLKNAVVLQDILPCLLIQDRAKIGPKI